MRLFVPGRICLLGEHRAGGYRHSHPQLEKGYAIIAGTPQRMVADVRAHASKLRARATLDDGSHGGYTGVANGAGSSVQEAEVGGFFSDVAGVP